MMRRASLEKIEAKKSNEEQHVLRFIKRLSASQAMTRQRQESRNPTGLSQRPGKRWPEPSSIRTLYFWPYFTLRSLLPFTARIAQSRPF